MIGLEYMIKLNDITQQEIADKLSIKQQNIDLWFRKTRNIPKKHLLILSQEFNLETGFFQKELTEIDKLKLQKLKLINECNKLNVKLEDI